MQRRIELELGRFRRFQETLVSEARDGIILIKKSMIEEDLESEFGTSIVLNSSTVGILKSEYDLDKVNDPLLSELKIFLLTKKEEKKIRESANIYEVLNSKLVNERDLMNSFHDCEFSIYLFDSSSSKIYKRLDSEFVKVPTQIMFTMYEISSDKSYKIDGEKYNKTIKDVMVHLASRKDIVNLDKISDEQWVSSESNIDEISVPYYDRYYDSQTYLKIKFLPSYEIQQEFDSYLVSLPKSSYINEAPLWIASGLLGFSDR